MEIIIIAAMAQNRIIGRNNKMPWHIPEELQLFKKTTMGHPMIMGRKTFDSLTAPLPGRRHIVLSRDPNYAPPGGEAAPSLAAAFDLCGPVDKVFVIGGAEIFSLALAVATTIILTTIEREIAGDVAFPELSEKDFIVTDRKHYPAGKEPFTVVTYRRRFAES